MPVKMVMTMILKMMLMPVKSLNSLLQSKPLTTMIFQQLQLNTIQTHQTPFSNISLCNKSPSFAETVPRQSPSWKAMNLHSWNIFGSFTLLWLKSTFTFKPYPALKPTVSMNNSMHCRLHPSGSTCCRIDQQIYISTTNVKHLFNISSSISAFSASNSALKGKINQSSLVRGKGLKGERKYW